jgi:hypothetical protein
MEERKLSEIAQGILELDMVDAHTLRKTIELAEHTLEERRRIDLDTVAKKERDGIVEATLVTQLELACMRVALARRGS